MLAGLISGCGINLANQLSENSLPPLPGRSVIVFGAANNTERARQMGFEDYNLKPNGNLDVSCWTEVYAVAEIPASDQPGIRYFVFSVPPGTYTVTASAFGWLPAPYSRLLFTVPADRIVYLGDYTKGEKGRNDVRFDLEAARKALKSFKYLDPELLEIARARHYYDLEYYANFSPPHFAHPIRCVILMF